MPRRGENIRKRKDGRWEARVRIKTDTGSTYKSVYAKTYREVKEKANEFRENISVQIRSDNSESICLHARIWLSEIKKRTKHSTYIKYSNIYQTHIMHIISNKTLKEISIDDLENIFFFKENGNKELSLSTRKTIKYVLVSILREIDPSYQLPKQISKNLETTSHKNRIEVFSKSEQKLLFSALLEEIDSRKLGILICLLSGLRLGEICCLKTENIDFKQKIIYINNTVQRIKAVDSQNVKKTMLVTSSPKTESGYRIIPISDNLFEILKEHISLNDYVVNGSACMEPRTYQYYFKRLLIRLNIDVKCFHTLRHTFATNCIANGMDVKCLSEILGHSDIQITLNKYVHPTLDTKRTELNKCISLVGQK